MTPEDFPQVEFQPNGAAINYGFFGFSGHVVDRSISQDRQDWLQECIDRGWIDKASETMAFLTVRKLCADKGALRCEKLLADLGWSLERQ
jgi:hypothetical protein